MNKQKHANETMAAALRDIDPAPAAPLTEAERQRASDTFTRIVTSSPDDPDPEKRGLSRRGWPLLVPVGGVGAAVAALLLAGGPAFASWTATPDPLTPAKASEAADTCRADIEMSTQGEASIVAERRGEWTYVLIAEPTQEGACLMRNDLVGQDPAGHEIFGDLARDPERAPTMTRGDYLIETGSTAASVDEGWFRESWLTWTYGHVSHDVTAVSVHTPQGIDVEASVHDGRFVAWWPSEQPSSENLDVMGPWNYTITLADGSTRKVNR